MYLSEMIEVLNWVSKHWAELTTALGVGGGGGFVAKKITDRKQDKKISYLEDKLNSMDKQLIQLENDVKTNTMFDKQFRDQMEREYNVIKEGMKGVKDDLKQILGHLLDKK